jgi:hypothetical protein
MKRSLGDRPDPHDAHRTLDLGSDPVIHHRHHTVVHRVVVDGRPVVVKRARSSARVTLRAEAEVLGHVPADSSVQFVSLRETDDHTDLVLEDAGGIDLSDAGQLDEDSVRRALAGTVRSVARLHDAGWVHGALCAEHVVLDAEHRPTLCSLGSARRASTEDIERERRQLVSLVANTLRRHASSDRPAHERRASRALAERVRRTEATDSTTSASGAALVDLLEPDAEADRRRWTAGDVLGAAAQLPLGAIAATLALCGLAVVLLATDRADSPTDQALEVGTTTAGASAPPERLTDATTSHVAGHIVEHDGVRFAVGRSGDRVALGDWDCDGALTPALLRPRTGEVHVFDEWARPGAPVAARRLATRSGASELLVDHHDCGRLRLRSADGSIIDLDLDLDLADRPSPRSHEEDDEP